MQKGMTYIVLPRMQPEKSFKRFRFISSGSFQLFVGPASSGDFEQMNVLFSTRAVSAGWEWHQKLLGRNCGLSGVKKFFSTSFWQIARYSFSEPSHIWMLSGRQSSTASATHFLREAGASQHDTSFI